MAEYQKTIITNAGISVLNRVLASKATMTFTRAVSSTDDLSGKTEAELRNMTSFSNIMQNGICSRYDIHNQNMVSLDLVFTNEGLGNSYMINTVGLYAKPSDSSTEVLYAIARAGKDSKGNSLAEQMPAYVDSKLTKFTISLYTQVGQSSSVAVSITDDGVVKSINGTIKPDANGNVTVPYHSRAEFESVMSQGYVELPVEDSEKQQLHGHDGKALSFKKSLIEHDATLSKQGVAADAYAAGRRINDLDNGLTQLNQEIYKTFDTKDNAQDLKNGILSNADAIAKKANSADVYTKSELDPKLANKADKTAVTALQEKVSSQGIEIVANADANRNQDSKISVLQNRASELERNSQTLHLLGHDRNSISSHSQNAFTTIRQFFVNDSTLTNPNGFANSKVTGDAINDLDADLTQLNQEIYKTFDTKDNAQDLKNEILSNADTNRDQDSKISILQNRASELERNSQTLHLLRHDGNSISDHSRNTFTTIRQFFVNDSTLTNPDGFANAKATGDAINVAYQQLSHAIGLIMSILDSLDKK